MRGWAEAAGRDWSKFGIEARLNGASGTPDDWRAQVEEWTRLGATHMSVNTMGGKLGGAEGHVKRLREVIEAVR